MITIDWGVKVINIPQSDLTFISGSLYELNVNTFRLALKSLEDDEAGMHFPRTHNHNTIVTVAGVTLARVIEIINGYTVTFQDGQYAVNLVGGNTNISDVTNINQVSIRSSNTAGLIQVTSGSGVTAQDIIDIKNAVLDEALAGHNTTGTVGKKLIDTALEATSTLIKNKTDNLPSDPASTTNVSAVDTKLGTPAGATVSADIAGIKVDTGQLTTDYTASRAAKIDNLDTTISSRASATNVSDVGSVVTDLRTDYTTTRATKLDNLDTTISSRSSPAEILSDPANLLVTDSDGRVDISKLNGNELNSLVDGRIDTYVGYMTDGAIRPTVVDPTAWTYQAKIWVFIDTVTGTDNYTIIFFRNGEPVTSSIMSATLKIINISDGSTVLNGPCEELGVTGLFKHSESVNRLVRGTPYIARSEALIAGSPRVWYQPIGRDR